MMRKKQTISGEKEVKKERKKKKITKVIDRNYYEN